MIGKKKLAITAAGIVVAAGTAIGVSGLVAGTAHAQGTSSLSIVGMGENSNNTAATVEVSFTCTSTGSQTVGTPSFEVIDVTATQGGIATGSMGSTICTGSPQTATITLTFPSSLDQAISQFGTGPVQVGATAQYEYRGSYPYTYSYTGTAATVSYTNP